MSLTEQLQSDLRAAMKARDTDTVAALRMVLTAFTNARVAQGGAGEVDDAQAVELLAREAKQRSEAAEAYERGGRTELADKERRELAVIQRYLPEQLGDDELRALVDATVEATGAAGPQDMGKVMGALMPKVKGRADGKHVSALVRERLS